MRIWRNWSWLVTQKVNDREDDRQPDGQTRWWTRLPPSSTKLWDMRWTEADGDRRFTPNTDRQTLTTILSHEGPTKERERDCFSTFWGYLDLKAHCSLFRPVTRSGVWFYRHGSVARASSVIWQGAPGTRLGSAAKARAGEVDFGQIRCYICSPLLTSNAWGLNITIEMWEYYKVIPLPNPSGIMGVMLYYVQCFKSNLHYVLLISMCQSVKQNRFKKSTRISLYEEERNVWQV